MANEISPSNYSIQEKMLKLAAKHFGNEEVIKFGMVGYTTELAALVHSDGTLHRNSMYDELFKSTAKLPSSINRYASWQKWEIPQASPSMAVVSLALPYDAVKAKIDLYTNIVIKRQDYFDIGGFKFSVPYDVIISESNGNISARFNISSNMTALSNQIKIKYQNSSFIQVAVRSLSEIDPSINDNTRYIYLLLDVYQYEIRDQIWEHYNAKDSIDRAMYYEGEYSDQLVKFDVLHNGKLIDKFYNFNETSANMYCFYSYLSDGKVSIFFDNRATLKPTFGSVLKAEYCTSLGSKANFDFVGTPYFKFNQNELSDIESFVTIMKQPSGGQDKMTLDEIRQYLAYLDLSRESLTTEYDLENYFQTIIDEQTTSAIKLKFFKKRDDIIKRIFYSFILFLDKQNNVIPTTTANITMPFSAIESKNNLLKVGTLFKYDYKLQKIRELVGSEFEDLLNEKFGDLFYMLPFSIKFNFEKFDNAEYVDLYRSEVMLTKYIPDEVKSVQTTDIIVNSININRDPLNSDEYKIDVPFILTNTEGFNIPLDVKMKLNFYNGNSKILRASKELTYNVTSGKFETTVRSGDRFNSLSEILIQDIHNEQTGENVAYLPEQLVLVIKTEIKENNIWHTSSSFETIDKEKVFFQNMDIACKSTVMRDSSGNINISDIPLLGANFGLNSSNFSQFITQFKPLIGILSDSVTKMENNTEVDIKFFNTYGISIDYNVPTTNIATSMRIKMKSNYDATTTTAIRSAVIKIIADSSNKNEVISFSTIINILKRDFDSIDYIIPIGFNHSNVCNGGADVIKPVDNLDAEQSINSFTNHPPEFINLNNVYRYGVNTGDLVIDFI